MRKVIHYGCLVLCVKVVGTFLQDSEDLNDDTITPETRENVEQAISYYSQRLAELEEIVDGEF